MGNQILDFYGEIFKLKTLIRTGWKNKNLERKESVAEHCFSMGMLAIAIIEKEKLNLDLGKVLKMVLVHELGEIDYGDITLYDNVSTEDKHNGELKGVKRIIEIIGDKSMLELWLEFEERKTPEAIFVFKMDKLDAIIQSKIYSDILDRQDIFKQFFENGKDKIGEYSNIFKE